MPSTPATIALKNAGVAFSEHEYHHDPRVKNFGAEAADKLGLDSSCVFKTIVVATENEALVAVVPVDAQVDLKALAREASAKKCELMPPEKAQKLTGYVVGGISPVGQKQALRTFIDDSCIGLSTMYVSGGKRGFDLGISPEDLQRMTSGVLATIAMRR